MRTLCKLGTWVLAGVMCVGLVPAFASAHNQRTAHDISPHRVCVRVRAALRGRGGLVPPQVR